MPSGEKQPPVSAKKVTLRDLPSETNNFAPIPLDYSPPKDKGSITDTPKLSGTKREQPSSPCTPHPHEHSISSGHLVYVRRKLDSEPSKVCIDNEERTDPHLNATKSSGEHMAKLSGVSALLSPVPLNSSPAPHSESQDQGEGYWKERFIRLQMSLKNCDQYNQEKYIQSLRSLSAAGRSLHAVELEKRAIQLLLDEGRELQKMKLLNVLGKPLTDSQIGLAYQAFSPEPLASEK